MKVCALCYFSRVVGLFSTGSSVVRVIMASRRKNKSQAISKAQEGLSDSGLERSANDDGESENEEFTDAVDKAAAAKAIPKEAKEHQ